SSPPRSHRKGPGPRDPPGGALGDQAVARGRVPGTHEGRRGSGNGMNEAALTLRQLRFTNRSFWRNPASAFFTFAFPLMFLVIFSVLLGNGTVSIPGVAGEIKQSTFYTPAIVAFSVITACYTNIAISVTSARAAGAPKRIHGT